MNTYGNNLSACRRRSLCLCNQSKSKTMTLNLITRKNLFRLSQFFKRRADAASRRGQDERAKILLAAWEKMLDIRDKLR